eukprot:447388-Pelagomonas_calceolata.AAC.1
MPDIAEPFILVLPGQHLSQTYFRMGGAQGQELSGQANRLMASFFLDAKGRGQTMQHQQIISTYKPCNTNKSPGNIEQCNNNNNRNNNDNNNNNNNNNNNKACNT